MPLLDSFLFEMHLFTTIGLGFVLFFAPLGCGGQAGQNKSTNPPHSASKGSSASAAKAKASDGPIVLLGWFCPEMASGRPGIRPLLAKDPVWTSELEPLGAAIASRRVKRFTVLSYRGQRAGTMTVAGAAKDAGGRMAIGSYLGASLCALQGEQEEDPTCLAQTQGCGLAIGSLESAGGFEARPYEEDPEAMALAPGGACETDEVLVVDVDGDGQPEHFALADLQSQGEPPVELPLATTEQRLCQENFTAAVSGAGQLHRVAVIDVDGDGRLEILYRRALQEFVLYGAPNSPARMELLGRQIVPTSTTR